MGGQKQSWRSQQAPFPPLLPLLWVHAGSGEHSTWVSLSALVQAWSAGRKRRASFLLGSLPWVEPEENHDLVSFGHSLHPRLSVLVALLAPGGDAKKPPRWAASSGRHALMCMHAHPGCLFMQPGVSLQKPRCDEDGAGRQSRTTTSVSSLQGRKSKCLLELPGRQRYQQGGWDDFGVIQEKNRSYPSLSLTVTLHTP